MFARITGTLLEKKPPQIVVDTASGLAYEIDVPMSTLYTLPEVGQAVSLYLHLAIREDAHVLYGFASASERASFRQLIKITGIGARTALGILSGLSSDDLQQAIAQQDVSRLTSIPGIGKKTAERLVLELKDKVANLSFDYKASASTSEHPARSDVGAALVALGYGDKEVANVMKNFPNDLDVNEGIRWALQQLSK
jgi:Holliday junction DNA helicase RuvA